MSSEPNVGLLCRRGSNRRFTQLVRSSANVRAAGQEKEMRGSLGGTVIGQSFRLRMEMGEPWPVGFEEGTLEHVENNVREECVWICLGDHVSDWVFKEEGS